MDAALLQQGEFSRLVLITYCMIAASSLLTLINTVLITGTLYLGIQTAVFQKRTSLRESLEQLDSLYIEKRREYIGVLLHQFNYFPYRSESAVLKFYVRLPTPEEKANVGMIRNAEKTLDEVFDKTAEDFVEYDRVTEAWADESGFYIKTDTVDSVECRELAERIQIDLELSFVDGDEIPR